MGYLSTVSHSTNLLGFLKDVQEAPVSPCFQRVLVYLFFVVCIVQFHASLPTLEMLLGFSQERSDVKFFMFSSTKGACP